MPQEARGSLDVARAGRDKSAVSLSLANPALLNEASLFVKQREKNCALKEVEVKKGYGPDDALPDRRPWEVEEAAGK